MKVELKTWTSLGVATALAGLSIAGCSEEPGDASEDAQISDASVGGEGEGGEGEGEGGEGGEGGINIAAASSDPVIFGSALAVAEAHVLAARDAHRVGQSDSAAEMFAHPLSEVLLEMDPVFAELGIDDMKPMFEAASKSILDGASVEDVDKQASDIIAALRAAEGKAPDNGVSGGAIAGGVVADQIERAVSMYAIATQSDAYGPYLDGYGFYQAGKGAYDRSADAIRAENADLATKIEGALGLLADAYPGAERPAALEANQGQLSGASSSVQLAAS